MGHEPVAADAAAVPRTRSSEPTRCRASVTRSALGVVVAGGGVVVLPAGSSITASSRRAVFTSPLVISHHQ